jgi:signal peptidase II
MNNQPSSINAPRRRIFWMSLAALIILCDQISKWAMTEVIFRPYLNLPAQGFTDWYINTPERLDFLSIPITSFFNLVMVWNTGVSFGMLGDHGANAPIILIALASVITIIFLIWMMRISDHLHGICFAMIIGGAVGNIIDRARFGAVIDFLDFHLYGYHWPAFNIADMSVVMGVGLLVILTITFDLLAKDRYRKTQP